ncbi:PREDICTED: acid phosphatase type 7-like [Amphimedon queenslandica]|uniref:Purple acid phosphatase n=1 Tax=Amphimedon queenslandica TaxID=400682 RepID=A0AAN0IKA7_AMPQE|nr:PREDICTED: acid phosphatase type 7-like [Amphimedon queenslandica]|eukprot:XP_011402694.2 PREDICTED: acid phosphatase type 7-like [Amphimedon queenslandica]
MNIVIKFCGMMAEVKNVGFVFSLALIFLVAPIQSEGSTFPEQIHIAATEDPTSVIVTWITFASTPDSTVLWRLHGSAIKLQPVSGYSTNFNDGKVKRFVHRVKLSDLKPSTKYDYQCGSSANWSSLYTMRTLGSGPDYSPVFLVYGDFGYDNAQSMSRIRAEVNAGGIDAILHVGDLAYDIFEDDGRKGDNFMNMIQSVATQIPYMTLPGNHEYYQNFSDYRNRFSMPGGHESIFYSFDVGKAHIIMFSTEVYLFIEFGVKQIGIQYEWLEQDLKKATTPEALAERPWIIAMAHHPMYCSTVSFGDCNRRASIIRAGTLVAHSDPLEKLFYKYGVDMFVSGHKHIYERMWPLYDYQVLNGSYDAPYTNPKGIVHLITGSAGCRERHDTYNEQPDWLAFVNGDYGFTKMTVHNGTHVSFKQISDDQDGKIVDSFTVIKEKPGYY